MSITLYVGFVGGGKSYAATSEICRIIDAPFGKGWVIANFPVKPKKETFFNKLIQKGKEKEFRFIYKDNEQLTVDFLISKSLEMGWNKKESSCLLVFDEASIPFNSRTYAKKDRLDWIKFLTQSRKFGYDIVFITQDENMLDKQIRLLCEYTAIHKRLNNMFAFKILSLFGVTLFAQIKFWNGMRKERGNLRMYFYRKSIANRYDTLRLFEQNIPEEETDALKE